MGNCTRQLHRISYKTAHRVGPFRHHVLGVGASSPGDAGLGVQPEAPGAAGTLVRLAALSCFGCLDLLTVYVRMGYPFVFLIFLQCMKGGVFRLLS